MGNRLVQPHRVKLPLLHIGNNSLIVFQCTGYNGLAMPFKHRHINHIVHSGCLIAQPNLHPLGVVLLIGILLQINQRHIISARNFPVSRCRKSRFRMIAHPGPFHNGDIFKPIPQQILNYSGQQLTVRCCTSRRMCRQNQIRL